MTSTTTRPAYPWLPADQCGVRLATDVARVPAYDGLDAGALERAGRLLATVPAVSLHDHPVLLPDPMEAATWQAWRADGRETLGYDGLAGSGLAGVFASSLSGADVATLTRWAGLLQADLAHRADAIPARLAGDVPPGAAGPSGTGAPLAVFLSLEDLGGVGTDISGIEVLYGAGIRCAGLAYNPGNALGGGLASDPDEGLTPLGAQAVALMNDIGMIIDLSHVGDRTSLDACRASTRPVVITHAGSRALWPTPRMKPDDVVRAVAETGGVIGVEAAPNSTLSTEHRRHDLEAIMHHVEYLTELVGVDHVGFGPDTFFGDHMGFYRALNHRNPWPVPDHEQIEYVAGMENPGEAIRNAAAWLIARGWTDTDIAKLAGGNALRVLRAVEDDERN
ncbi:MAG TPA: membrane dipeptidase [Trebonia sp.]|jgi:membrane dipeptidase